MVDSGHRHRPELQGVEHQPAQRHVALPDDGQHARHAVQQYSRVQYSNVQYSNVQYSTIHRLSTGFWKKAASSSSEISLEARPSCRLRADPLLLLLRSWSTLDITLFRV